MDLCKLRREKTSIRTQNFAFDLVDSEHRTVVYHRWLGEADQVVVGVNKFTVVEPPPSGLLKVKEEVEISQKKSLAATKQRKSRRAVAARRA